MKNSALFLLFFALSILIYRSYGQAQPTTSDLLFVASFSDYEDWYQGAFRPDTRRRSTYCKEAHTLVGKIDKQGALVYLNSFDLSRMPEFASDKTMDQLLRKYEVEHSEVYRVHEFDRSHDSGRADLLFRIKMVDYDLWMNEAFGPDATRRAAFCDEARTKVARISDKEALVVLYDFELDQIWEFGAGRSVEEKMKQYQVEHEVFQLSAL